MGTRTLAFGLLSALALAACATPVGTNATAAFDRFEPNSTADLSEFSTIHLAPAKASQDVLDRIGYKPFGPNDDIRPLGQKDIDRNLERLSKEFERELSKVATLTGEAGDGVLTITPILVDVSAQRPTLAELSATPGLSIQSVAAGGASVDVEFSENGTVLATANETDKASLAEQINGGPLWSEANKLYARTARKVAAIFQ